MPEGASKVDFQPPPYRLVPSSSADEALPAFFKLERNGGLEPTADQERLAGALNGAILADVLRKPAEGGAAAAALAEARKRCAEELTAIAGRFLAGTLEIPGCFQALGTAMGRMEAAQSVYDLAQSDNRHNVELQFEEEEKTPIDLDMRLGSGELTNDQARVVVEVRKALTVTTIVFDRRIGEAKRRGEYIRKLYYIATCGLASETGATQALSALESFREEFVSREADVVKNQYVRKLAICAALFALGFFALHLFAQGPPGGFGTGLGSKWPQLASRVVTTLADPMPQFLLLAVGASAGTWLSFALRRPFLGFADLAVLEDDRLAPTARIAFVIGLTWVIGLLIHNKLVVLQVGGVSIDLAMALLLGLLCGISERALAGAVSKRASDILDPVAKQPAIMPAPITPAGAAGAASVRAASGALPVDPPPAGR